MSPLEPHPPRATDHVVDMVRTVIHDNDRGGDFYSTWCVCGVQLTNRAPCWEPHDSTCRESVYGALDRHRELEMVAR